MRRIRRHFARNARATELAPVARYLQNLTSNLSYGSKAARILYLWLERDDEFAAFVGTDGSSDESPPLRASNWKGICAVIKRIAQKAEPTDLQQNAATLCRELSLDETSARHFECLLTANDPHSKFCHLWNGLFNNVVGFDHIEILARMMGETREKAKPDLDPDGPLARNGLIHMNDPRAKLSNGFRAREEIDDIISIPIAVLDAIAGSVCDAETLRARIIGQTAQSELEWSDFDHLAADRDMMLDVLRGAAKQHATGVNILVYGSPGTGKTEFCKAVAQQAGLGLHQIGDDEYARDGDERIAPLLLASRLFARNHGSALLFDEMEDILPKMSSMKPRRGCEKLFLNRLLENNSLPTLWTCNSLHHFDPALLRRMTLAVDVEIPSVPVRKRVWKRILGQNDLDLPDEKVQELARAFEAPPALAANAVRAASFADGEAQTVERAVRGLARVLNGGQPLRPPQRAPENYNPALVRFASDDPEQMLKTLASCENRAFSLCLNGPSGTGKSAFVRALAEQMGLPIMQKRASDLLNMFVGGTEKSIARAFEKAADEGAFLIFDEADSLLRDRRRAQRSWEITQVNEMLTWMESHPLPFACTTNLAGSLDPATERRFIFKIKVLTLDATRLACCFDHFFGLEAPAGIAKLDRLTPGDFALVRRQAEITGEADDPAALLRRLSVEHEAKSAQDGAGSSENRHGGNYV